MIDGRYKFRAVGETRLFNRFATTTSRNEAYEVYIPRMVMLPEYPRQFEMIIVKRDKDELRRRMDKLRKELNEIEMELGL